MSKQHSQGEEEIQQEGSDWKIKAQELRLRLEGVARVLL